MKQALGTLGFAAALANGDRAERICAAVAVVGGVAPLAVLGASYPEMNINVILGVLGGQLAWNLATVSLLWRAPTRRVIRRRASIVGPSASQRTRRPAPSDQKAPSGME